MKRLLDASPNTFHCPYVQNAYTKSGVPDILVCYRGIFIGMEIKGSGGVVSKIQRQRIEQIKGAGGVAGVVYNVDDAKALLAEADMLRDRP